MPLLVPRRLARSSPARTRSRMRSASCLATQANTAVAEDSKAAIDVAKEQKKLEQIKKKPLEQRKANRPMSDEVKQLEAELDRVLAAILGE